MICRAALIKFLHVFIAGYFILNVLNPPKLAYAKPEPGVSGLLSIVPGLGQAANGDTLEGVGWFVTSVGLFFIPRSAIARQVGYDLWLYNMYDAYRDAGAAQTAKYSVFENYLATFNPLNLIDPIAAPVLALGGIAGGNDGNIRGIPRPLWARPFIYGFVGLGEEGLFRGFIYHGLSNVFSSKILGAVTSSVLFAYFHVTNGVSDIDPPHLISRTIMGLVFCLQTTLHQNDIRESIFTHAWWDFLVTRNGGIKGASLGYKFRF